MASDDIKQAWKVPEPTLRRLPWYLAFVKLMKGKGEAFISSTQIAKEINVDPSQVAKDLSFVNISGKTRVGYDINALVDVLEDFLGFTSQHKAFLFGVGSLGASLLHDTGLSQYGLEIVAGFDVREDLDGSMINGIPVFHMDDFPAKHRSVGEGHLHPDESPIMARLRHSSSWETQQWPFCPTPNSAFSA